MNLLEQYNDRQKQLNTLKETIESECEGVKIRIIPQNTELIEIFNGNIGHIHVNKNQSIWLRNELKRIFDTA